MENWLPQVEPKQNERDNPGLPSTTMLSSANQNMIRMKNEKPEGKVS